ncbi:MAG: O-acetyl-ADP-ribose deacetylase [Acidobacteria bacterium]|nr:O-acetyl-ADP-ribose deacetylase [Acidobacteriota bacterium]
MEWSNPEGRRIRLVEGDITRVPVDAIANAANSALAGGGGVDGAIHRAGGPAIMRELDVIRARQGGCPTGRAVATTAGNLPAKWVFHAVGPVYRDGRHNEPALLASAYRGCLDLAREHGARTLSFPSISTGVYGYPIEEAARIAIATVREHLAAETTLEEVVFVLFGRAAYDTFAQALG